VSEKSKNKLSKSEAKKGPSDMEIVKTLSEYLHIAIFLAFQHGHLQWLDDLINSFKMTYSEFEHFPSELIPTDPDFCLALARKLIKQDEYHIFEDMLKSQKTINYFIRQSFLSELVSSVHNLSFPTLFFKEFQSRAKKLPHVSTEIKRPLDGPSTPHRIDSSARDDNLLTRSRLIMLCRFYFAYTTDNNMILSILDNLDFKNKDLLALLIDIKDEDRLVQILHKNKSLFTIQDLPSFFRKHMYCQLLLLDPMELINVFNMKIDPHLQKSPSVYTVLCRMISHGDRVESVCNIINYVNETFWDIHKLRRFFEALKSTIYNKESSWLVKVKNPLLFSITLVYFFQKLKEQLDYNDKDILMLRSDMLAFCKIYIENASEESLSVNFYDKDGYGKRFLDYAFMVGDMSILETEQIEGRILEMWDLKRHTMQVLWDFMQINMTKSKLKRFVGRFFRMDYSLPIEPDDAFQMEFKYVSNSTQVKVYSELFWPITCIIMEMIFSLMMIHLKQEGLFTRGWLRLLFSRYTTFMVFLTFIRISYILSSVIKTLSISKVVDQVHYMQLCFNTHIFITFFQTVICWTLFPTEYYTIAISQMLYVLSVVTYVLLNALSLNNIGVLLRIFFRMTMVVIIFGTISLTYITAIGYTIHVIFLDFTQKAVGQIYTDFNLFSDLYQGILTLYEFIFGAVVLYRPYLEENAYSYALTFVMVMFAFFGNIMLANMLVAFLTSQFDHITTNAKFLTLSLQFSLVNVFERSDFDTLISMPYPLVPFALPIYAAFLCCRQKMHALNLFLRKAIYLLNIFLPIMIIMPTVLLIMIPFRYFAQLVRLFIRIPFRRSACKYFLMWLIKGLPLLFKLYAYDIRTLWKVLLNFDHDGSDLLNYQLSPQTSIKLIAVFSRILKVINRFRHDGKELVSMKEFLDFEKQFEIQNMVAQYILHLGDDNSHHNNHNEPKSSREGKSDGQGINQKYSQQDMELVPILLEKYSSAKADKQDDMIIDLNFMYEKIRNHLTTEEVGRLIAFEKSTLDKASEAFAPEPDRIKEALEAFDNLHKFIDYTEERAAQAVNKLLAFKQHLKK
jgi:hypothetical protein